MKSIQIRLVAAAVVAVVGIRVLPLQALTLLDYKSYAYSDSSGTWDGVATYNSLSLSGSVEWLVFGPGEFAQAFSGSSGYSPPATELVYAYQILPSGSSDTSTLESAIVAGRPADTIGTFSLTNGVAPTTANFQPPSAGYYSAYWNFSGGIFAGSASTGLAYASPNTPENEFGTLVNSGLFATTASSLPAPSTTPLSSVPEPSAVILLAVAAIVLGIRRRFWTCGA